jgi:extradiol dioxygenase family protein
VGNQPLFHLAFPVTNLDKTREFYCNILGCSTGRESQRWIDFDFFGHQLVAHLVNAKNHPAATNNAVDGHAVPASHFGVILDWQVFESFVVKLEQAKVLLLTHICALKAKEVNKLRSLSVIRATII